MEFRREAMDRTDADAGDDSGARLKWPFFRLTSGKCVLRIELRFLPAILQQRA